MFIFRAELCVDESRMKSRDRLPRPGFNLSVGRIANVDGDFAKSIRDVDFVAIECLAFPRRGLAVGNPLQPNCDDCLCGVQAPARAIIICHRTAPLFSSTPHLRCVGGGSTSETATSS